MDVLIAEEEQRNLRTEKEAIVIVRSRSPADRASPHLNYANGAQNPEAQTGRAGRQSRLDRDWRLSFCLFCPSKAVDMPTRAMRLIHCMQNDHVYRYIIIMTWILKARYHDVSASSINLVTSSSLKRCISLSDEVVVSGAFALSMWI